MRILKQSHGGDPTGLRSAGGELRHGGGRV